MKHILHDSQQPLLADDKIVASQSNEKAVVLPSHNPELSIATLDDKLDSKDSSPESLLIMSAGSDEKNYMLLADNAIAWPMGLPPKLTKFLQQTHLTSEQLQRANISFDALNQCLNQGYSGYILRWLALDDTFVKAVMYPLLDERAIQAEEIPEEKNNPNNKKYCSSLTKYAQTRVWPRGSAIPFKSEKMIKRAYGVSGFFDGVETIVTRVWTVLLTSLLVNDLYYYYTYPDERYGTTLSQLFFTQSNNEQSLTASLTRLTVWPELLVAPIAWGIIKAIRMSCATDLLDVNALNAIRDRLQQYQSSFVGDVLAWFLPINRDRDTLDQIQQRMLWDNRLSAEQRNIFSTSVQSLSRRASKMTQWYALETLGVIADGIALADFERLMKNSISPENLISLLQIKTQALTELQYQVRHYKYPTSRETSWYAHYLKPLPRYLLAHYLLWCLGQPESKGLQPLFWSFKAAKGYIKIKLLYTLYLGIKQLIEFYAAKRSCEAQGKLWLYMDQVADYICSVCGDLPVYYKNIFSMANCLNDLLGQPQPISYIVTLLNRIQLADNITVLDFSNQQFSDNVNEIDIILPIIRTHLPQLEELYFYLHKTHAMIGAAGAVSVANYLAHSNLHTLNLNNQGIGDNATEFIARALPYSKLQMLDLGGNKIVNVSALAQALPRSALQSLYLSYNQIVDISALAQALPQSNLQTLYLGFNQIADINPLMQALPRSNLQILNLGDNQIVSINVLEQALLQSKLQNLNLGGNQIVNVSGLAQTLPQSALQSLYLHYNQIADINALMQALPQSNLQMLALGGNQIVDINPLRQALSQSNLQTLDLSGNQIIDISALAQALPQSNLQTLDLSSNQIVDISALTQALPQSNLQTLDLSSNQIVNISALAQALPRSTLQTLDLSFNQIADLNVLALALLNSNLQTLDLGFNQIIDIHALAQALPRVVLQFLYLTYNQIIDISALAQALLYSKLQILDLGGNQIVDIRALVQALPQANLQMLDLGGNQIVDIRALAQALPQSNLQTLGLAGNQIVNISALAQALPQSALQSLYLSYNQIIDISALAQALPQTNLQALDLGYNQIADITALSQTLPQSMLQILDLRSNPLSDIGIQAIANILTTAYLNSKHSLWINSLDPNERRIISQAQPNTDLVALNLINTNINTTGAIALCRVLPQTNIPIQHLRLEGNPGVDRSIVDINTCIISAASSLQPPLPLRFFYGLTQLTFYPVKQTYFSLCNLLANKPIPASSTIKTLQTDEKINHALLWQMSNHTEKTGQVSPLALADDANISVPRFNSSKTNDTLVLFFFTLLAGYALYRLVQTTTQSFSSFISTADEKSVSPLASNKTAKPTGLHFISAWWQSRPVETNLTGEHFGEAMKHLIRALLRVDRVLRRLDQHESQLSKEMQTDVDRIRFYWLEHMEMVEDFRSAAKAKKKEIVELRTAIRELQTEADELLKTLPINDSRFFKSHVPIELAAYPANKPAVTPT